jgi:hypothetical protein
MIEWSCYESNVFDGWRIVCSADVLPNKEKIYLEEHITRTEFNTWLSKPALLEYVVYGMTRKMKDAIWKYVCEV